MLPISGRLRAAVQELPAQLAELLDAQAAAAVLEQEVEAGGGAEARDGRDVEREDDRLGDARDLRLQRGHDAAARAAPAPCRSSHGLSRTKIVPKFGW